MSISKFIARRYVFSHGRHHFFSFIACLTSAGVALGSASMIVVLSVIGGFESEFRDRFLAANAHILMFNYPKGLDNYGEVSEKARSLLEQDSFQVTGVSPFIHMETMAKKHGGLVSTLVRGIHPSKREQVQPYEHLISPASSVDILEKEVMDYDPHRIPSVIMGVGLARLLDADVGDRLKFLVPSSQGSLGVYQTFKMIGTYDSGLSHYDNKLAIVSIPGAQQLFHMKGHVTGVEMGLVHPWRSHLAQQRLARSFQGMVIKNWKDYNQSFFEAIQYEKVLISLLVSLVALVSGFNILTTLFVSVFQKERDILLLMSLGSSKRQVMEIFLYQGLYIGVIGSIVGCIGAFLMAQAIDSYQFIRLPQVYMLAQLPVEFSPIVYGGTALGCVLIAICAGVLPAFAAIKGDVSMSLKSR